MRLDRRFLTSQMKDKVRILFVDVLKGFFGIDHDQFDPSPFRHVKSTEKMVESFSI